MTRREIIIKILTSSKLAWSCQELCKFMIAVEGLKGNKARYLSGSVSSILKKLVDKKILEYSDVKTKRAGHKYKIVEK